MDINGILTIILIIVFCLVGVALIFFLIELMKTLKSAQKTIDDLGPTLKNVEEMTTNLQPTVAKADPMMDRVLLTLDSVNLEMMRVDKILEDVSEITDTAAGATAAVDTITNAPVKAVESMAAKMKSKFTPKSASDESAQLAEQRVAVAQALKDYEKAEESKEAAAAAFEPEPVDDKPADKGPKKYVEIDEGNVPAGQDSLGSEVRDE